MSGTPSALMLFRGPRSRWEILSASREAAFHHPRLPSLPSCGPVRQDRLLLGPPALTPGIDMERSLT